MLQMTTTSPKNKAQTNEDICSFWTRRQEELLRLWEVLKKREK